METDDYALALAHKYRLAISIAILKAKPDNLTIDQYVEELRNTLKLKSKEVATNDLDFSACSDDFNIDDDDVEIEETNITLRNDNNISKNDEKNDCTQSMDYQYDVSKTKSVNKINNVRIQLNENDIQGNVIEPSRNSLTQHINNIKEKQNANNQDYDNNSQDNANSIGAHSKIQNAGNKCDNSQVKETQESASKIVETETRDPNKERREKFREVISIMKGLDVTAEKVAKGKSIQTPGVVKSFDPADIDLTQCYDENDTLFDSLNILENSTIINIHENNAAKSKNANASKICERIMMNLPKIANITPCNNLNDRKRKQEIYLQNNESNDKTKVNKKDSTNDIKVKVPNPRKLNNITLNCDKVNHNIGIIELNKEPTSIKTINSEQTIYNVQKTINDIVETQSVYLVGDMDTQDTQSNTCYSESQITDIVIDKHLLYSAKTKQNSNENDNIQEHSDNLNILYNNDKNREESIRELNIKGNLQTTQGLPNPQQVTDQIINNPYDFTLTQNIQTYNTLNSSPDLLLEDKTNQRNKNTDANINKSINKDVKTYDKITTCLKQNANDNNMEIDGGLLERINIERIENNTDWTMDSLRNYSNLDSMKSINKVNANMTSQKENTNCEDLQETKILENQNTNTTIQAMNNKSLDNIKNINEEVNNENNSFENEEEIDEVERIPFKILEEMNQIKTYLSKKKEFKDSGYRSSQSQRSILSTQPSCMQVGESADCIFNYLTSCPLDVATQELTEQISEVLGQIIDRLHEDEIYPKFMEELLNSVEMFLHLVYEEESYGFDVLQKKDEQTQRIILLNKSPHIIKYTIEKINNILRKILEDISDTDYEIQHIEKLENLCYIFHILQYILPKYIKRNNTNQASQESQENITKIDISDIWRKKWFNKKTEVSENIEEKCVIKECRDILNKLVVNCMEGYSLISFFALKCYNLMQ